MRLCADCRGGGLSALALPRERRKGAKNKLDVSAFVCALLRAKESRTLRLGLFNKWISLGADLNNFLKENEIFTWRARVSCFICQPRVLHRRSVRLSFKGEPRTPAERGKTVCTYIFVCKRKSAARKHLFTILRLPRVQIGLN